MVVCVHMVLKCIEIFLWLVGINFGFLFKSSFKNIWLGAIITLSYMVHLVETVSFLPLAEKIS